MKSDEQRAQDALLELAQKRLKDSGVQDKVEEKAFNSLRKLGVTDNQLGIAAGAAKIADSLHKGEFKYETDLTDNLKLNAKISPREKALKLLYNKSF